LVHHHIEAAGAGGIDGGEARTGGFNPVTPRFYESAAARCHLIGRFPADGADFVANRVAGACRHVDSFDEFAAAVDRARHTSPDVAALDAFLVGHTTSEVARALRADLVSAPEELAA
jgi:CheY-like chemotaxis protein